MSEIEKIVGLVWPLALLIAGVLIFRNLVTKTAEVLKVKRHAEVTGKKGLQLPESAYQMLVQAEQGLDMQVAAIAEKCKIEKKNPMDDTGYNTVLNQYNRVSGLRQKFETNPLYMMVDQIGWPLVKLAGNEGLSMTKRLIKSIG